MIQMQMLFLLAVLGCASVYSYPEHTPRSSHDHRTTRSSSTGCASRDTECVLQRLVESGAITREQYERNLGYLARQATREQQTSSSEVSRRSFSHGTGPSSSSTTRQQTMDNNSSGWYRSSEVGAIGDSMNSQDDTAEDSTTQPTRSQRYNSKYNPDCWSQGDSQTAQSAPRSARGRRRGRGGRGGRGRGRGPCLWETTYYTEDEV